MPSKKPVDQSARLAVSDMACSGPPHANHRLFSDYFLNTLLPAEAPWKKHWDALKKDAQALKAELRVLFQRFAPSPTTDEKQTREAWIRPVLTLLGHTFEVQAELRVPGRTQRPDYVLYRSEEARKANCGRVLDVTAVRQGAIAVGDARRWLRPLDVALQGPHTGREGEKKDNPSFQVFFSMLHTRCPWGILTNGKHWRLYHEDTAYKLEICYEVDLPELLLAPAGDSFLYFYAFFRRAAFDPGPLSLVRLLEASVAYAERAGETLRQQAYEALCDIAQGFLEYAPNNITPTAEHCRLLHGSSLVLLCRLLFTFYAEARGLLPLYESTIYRQQFSLEAITQWAVRELQAGTLRNTCEYAWQRLTTLFTAMAEGNAALQVTTFNGGLFAIDTNEFHRFLATRTIGDPWICSAIEKLARINEQFIDYQDLSERHLGTIYEGFLAYTLHVATEPMVELRATGSIVPQTAQVPARDIVRHYKQHQVYLATDRGDRKATGSYYTPDYIVKYMVEQAIGATLDDALARMDTASDSEKIQKILSLSIIDPSMGSGRFLVEAVEFIARYIVQLDLQTEEAPEATHAYWKRRVVQQCIYGVDVNPLAVELAKLSLWLATAATHHPLNVLDHHLRVGNALVGCWLDEILGKRTRKRKSSAKQSLQTLYEREDIAHAQEEVMQQPLLDTRMLQADIMSAAKILRDIQRYTGDTVADVATQKTAFKRMRHAFQEKYASLANLRVALYYMDVSDDLWHPLAQHLLGKDVPGGPMVKSKLADMTAEALQIAQQRKRAFHWELEFPYLFYDEQGRSLEEHAGFDVIIGNPPYVRQEHLWEDKPFFEEHFDVFQGTADLFVYFFRQGLNLLRKNGRLIYLSSGTWLRANYATALRRYLRTQTRIEYIIDLGNTRVFADAPDLSPAIQMVRKQAPTGEQQFQAAIFTRTDTIKEFRMNLDRRFFPVSIFDQPDEGWQLKSNSSRQLLTRLLAQGKPLHQVVDGQIYRGLLTGLNEAFLIDKETRDRLVQADPMCSPLLKPVVRGEDLRPWYQEHEGRWLICIPDGWTTATFPELLSPETLALACLARRFPGLAAYLTSSEERGRTQPNQGQFWWEWGPHTRPETQFSPLFLLDESTRQHIVEANDADFPFIQAREREVSPGQDADEKPWLLVLPDGWTHTTCPELASRETLAWEKFAARHPALAIYLEPFAYAGRRRQDKGQFWWELRACDYDSTFENPKIFYPDIAKYPRFSWDESGTYTTNTGYFISTQTLDLLGILNSRVIWFILTCRSQPLAERKGTLIYRLFTQYIERLPVPSLAQAQQRAITSLVQQLTILAHQRYDIRRGTVQRLTHDLGAGQKKVSDKLAEWWKLSWPAFRDEVRKALNVDIPLKERKDWESALQEAKEEIATLTHDLLTLEQQLNNEVYALFKLGPEDIAVIEQETRYPYGEW